MLPSLAVLEKIAWKIKNIPNRKKESKRGVHFGCYLLCSKAGLRVSEAVSFDLANKTQSGLYRIEKPKGKNERLVYIPKRVIRELKKHSWKPNQTNRWNFYHFLKKIKRELNISEKVELTPHTLRRSFTTYHAENGLPLPLLQKLLGHSSIRTTALYWRNIYQEPDNDTANILTGKKWLEKNPSEPITENFAPPKVDTFPEMSKNPAPIFINQNPAISNKKPIQQDNSLLTSREQEKKPTISNYQPKLVINKVPAQQKLSLNITNQRKEISEQLPAITNKSQKENILLAKIKQLEEQLKKVQSENSNLKAVVQSEKQNNQLSKETITNLTHKVQADKQNHTNLINAYQKAFNDKAKAQQQVNYYEEQLKTIAKTLYQWQKIKHYQQLEQEKEIKAQIEQLPPWKSGK